MISAPSLKSLSGSRLLIIIHPSNKTLSLSLSCSDWLFLSLSLCLPLPLPPSLSLTVSLSFSLSVSLSETLFQPRLCQRPQLRPQPLKFLVLEARCCKNLFRHLEPCWIHSFSLRSGPVAGGPLLAKEDSFGWPELLQRPQTNHRSTTAGDSAMLAEQ